MTRKMEDRIITALDYANREKCNTVIERIDKLALKYGYKINHDRPAGIPVKARIDFGRWIADCECGGAEAVDPNEPIFFCLSCGNTKTGGRLRKVEFPENRKQIEIDVLAKPFMAGNSDDIIDRQLTGTGERNWRPEGGK